MHLDAKKLELRITADGSATLYRKDLDETYHSTHGALQEARHVFIEHGLRYFKGRKEISLLEIGLGTGLNALLTAIEAEKLDVRVNYHGLEAFPLPREILAQIDYTILDAEYPLSDWYEHLHATDYGQNFTWTEHVQMTKIHDTLQHVSLPENSYDLIYFDAFGFRAQEEMWHISLLEKLYKSIKLDGVLVTYAAKGSFKRDLKQLGFEVEALPGPPGKREMTRGKRKAVGY